MERQFGRANIRKLVVKYEEDQANKKWLDQSTMACPTCHVHVEKSLGCNHVRCAAIIRRECCVYALADDVCKMQGALLLPVRRSAAGEQPVQTLFDAGT